MLLFDEEKRYIVVNIMVTYRLTAFIPLTRETNPLKERNLQWRK